MCGYLFYSLVKIECYFVLLLKWFQLWPLGPLLVNYHELLTYPYLVPFLSTSYFLEL